jgi:hypothetical protein
MATIPNTANPLREVAQITETFLTELGFRIYEPPASTAVHTKHSLFYYELTREDGLVEYLLLAPCRQSHGDGMYVDVWMDHQLRPRPQEGYITVYDRRALSELLHEFGPAVA